MYTYGAGLPGDQTNCNLAKTCLARDLGGGAGGFGSRPLGIYMHIPAIAAPQPAPSTPDYLYAFPVKLMAFSTPDMFLKLDPDGPIAISKNLGDRKTTCTQQLGQTWSGF